MTRSALRLTCALMLASLLAAAGMALAAKRAADAARSGMTVVQLPTVVVTVRRTEAPEPAPDQASRTSATGLVPKSGRAR